MPLKLNPGKMGLPDAYVGQTCGWILMIFEDDSAHAALPGQLRQIDSVNRPCRGVRGAVGVQIDNTRQILRHGDGGEQGEPGEKLLRAFNRT